MKQKIDPKIFLKRVGDAKCIFCFEKLAGGESIVCRKKECLGGIYNKKGAWDKSDNPALESVIYTIVRAKKEPEFDGVAKSSVKDFFHLVLSLKEEVIESVLHWYLYIFWSQLDFDESPWRPHGEVFHEKVKIDGSSEPITRSVRRIREIVEVDLVAVNEERQEVCLIEVKRGSIDDRAVGQVLRYFEYVRRLLEENSFRQIPISWVRPVIIVSSFKRSDLDAFPLYFREILSVYSYSLGDNGEVRLKNERNKTLS